MTLRLDDATVRGALYGAAKQYPGKVEGLARDMDVPVSTLYGRLRGEKGYPLDIEDAVEILNFLRGQNVDGWDRAVRVFCHLLDHLAVPIPRAMRLGDVDGLDQVSRMMHEVADIAQALAAGVDENSPGGRLLNSLEWKRVDQECLEAIEKIAETRELYRAQHLEAKRKGVVK